MSRAFYSPVKPVVATKEEETRPRHKTADRRSRGDRVNHSTILNQSGVNEQRKRRNYFDEMSCGTKSKLGELLLTVAEEELMIER